MNYKQVNCEKQMETHYAIVEHCCVQNSISFIQHHGKTHHLGPILLISEIRVADFSNEVLNTNLK